MSIRKLDPASLPKGRREFYEQLKPEAKLLDVGCLGFREHQRAQLLGRTDIEHHGVDYVRPSAGEMPADFHFTEANLDQGALPYPDDTFDGVVASHVIEHLREPLRFFGECVRVCRPGGVIYVEAPSERSLLLPGVPSRYEMFCSFSFYDDPTHLSRPWTPQALYRMAHYFGCAPLLADHVTCWKHRLAFPVLFPIYTLLGKMAKAEAILWLAVGWSAFLLTRKPSTLSGAPSFRYYIPQR